MTDHESEVFSGHEPAVGRTTVAVRALQKIAQIVTAESAQVPAREVRVNMADAGGHLAISVALPLALSDQAGPTIAQRGDAVRSRVRTQMRELASREVSRVDVEFIGVIREPVRRVE